MVSGDFDTVLALDTSVNGCSVAVLDGKSRAVHIRPMERGHAEHLVPMIEEAMRERGLAYGDIDAVAVTVGPGAFTGIRIGLSTAQALGLSLSVPVFGLSTMQALALDYARQAGRDCVVAIDTRRGDFYAGRFDAQGRAMGAAQAVTAEDVAALAAALPAGGVVIGDGVSFLSDPSLPVLRGFELPDVSLIAEFAREENTRKAYFISSPAPIYLRDADVSQSSAKNRVLARE